MRAVPNKVLLSLTLAGFAALAGTGFVSEAPNRLLSGRPITLWHAVDTPILAGLGLLALVLFILSESKPRPLVHGAAVALAAALLLLLIDGAGEAAAALARGASPAARTLLGPAFWLAGLCALLAIIDGLQRLAAGPALRLGVALALSGLIAALIASGRLDALSLLREFAVRRAEFATALGRHCFLVIGALLPALLIGVPLGLFVARRPRHKGAVFGILNLLQTIPSIALFGLLIAPLSAIGVGGIGAVPAVIALVLYSLLPVVRNTEAGITGVDPAVVESARGMGFTPREILWRIEAPLGLPVFLAGLRIVLVQAIGLAVVAALIGAGGLGTFVFQGLGQYAIDLVLLGAIPAILLALAADFGMRLLIAVTARRVS